MKAEKGSRVSAEASPVMTGSDTKRGENPGELLMRSSKRGTELIMAAEARPAVSTRLRCEVRSSDAKAVEALRLVGEALGVELVEGRDKRACSLGSVWGAAAAAAKEAAVGVRSAKGDCQPMSTLPTRLPRRGVDSTLAVTLLSRSASVVWDDEAKGDERESWGTSRFSDGRPRS